MKAFLISVVCGEGENVSYTPLKVFLDEESADIFLEERKVFFKRETMIYNIAYKIVREWMFNNPAQTTNYSIRLDAETKRAYALVGYVPNRLPMFATVAFVFRKDIIDAD